MSLDINNSAAGPTRRKTADLAARALEAYKRFLSPLLPATCRFTPSCSEYAAEACARHGLMAGAALSTWRLLRCTPFSAGGLDPVPQRLFAHRCATTDRAPRNRTAPSLQPQ